MKKTLRLSIVFLLFFQTLTISTGVHSETLTESAEQSVVTDVSVTQAEEESEPSILHVSWSVKGLDVASDYTESIKLPEQMSIHQEQNGVLVTEEEEVGTYTATEENVLEISFNENIENFPEAGNTFDLHGYVTLSEENTEVEESKPNEEQVKAEKESLESEEEKSNKTLEDTEETNKNLEENQNNISEEEKELTSKDSSQYKRASQSIQTVINENIITDVKLSMLDENGESTILNPGEEIKVDNPYDAFKVELAYDFALPDGHSYKDGSTYTIEIPELFNVLANPEPIPLKDQSGVQFGSFVVTNNNEIKLTFNDEIEKKSNVSGYINLESEFDAHYKDSAETEIKFPIRGESEITYPIKFIPKGSSIDKSGVPNKSYNTETITWTVDFNKDLQEITNATLEDVLDGNHSYVAGTLEVYQLSMNSDGSIDETKTQRLDNHGFGNSFPLNLGDINSAYRIKYDTKINDNNGESYKNTAELTGEEFDTVKASASVDVKRGKPLEKKSSDYDNVTQTIEWEVKYNYDEKKIPQKQAKLTDRFGVNQELVDDSFIVKQVEIDPDTGEEIDATDIDAADYQVTENGTGFDFQFNSDIETAYKIIYETTAIDRIDNNNKVTNKISDEFGNENEGSRNIQQGILIKSHVNNTNYDTKETDWKVVINRDNYVMENVLFSDKLPEGFIPKNVVVKHGKETLEENSDFTYSFNGEDKKIEIDFTGYNITEKVIITYTTQIDFDKVNETDVQYTNSAYLEWIDNSGSKITKEGYAKFNPDQYTKQNGFKGAQYNPVTKEIKWTIGVNYNKTTVENAIVEDFILGEQNFDIDNVKVYEMELTGKANGYQKGNEVVNPTINKVTNENGEPGFQVELGEINTPYIIEYTTDLNGLLVEGSYDNKAILLDGDQVKNELKASVQPIHGGEYTDKNASQNKENPRVVNWNVNINFAQSTVTDLKIEDTPSINQALVEDSVKLYGTTVTEKGISKDTEKLLQEGEDYTLTVVENEQGQYTFTIDFNEDKIDRAYVLEYDTYILYKDDGMISNDAKFFANETTSLDTDDTYSNQINLSNISGGIDGEVGSLTITKTDHNDHSKRLSGAVFELYDETGEVLLNSKTTNQEGIVTFKNLLYGDYLLKESKAPEGYVVGINDQQTVTVDNKATELEVKNKEIIHEVELTKVDEANQETLKGAVFELYEKESSTLLGTFTTDEDGRIFVKELSPGEHYFIEKEAPDGYLLDEKPISFTIDEKATETVQVQAENTAIETTTIQGTKTWKDDDSVDRPETIIVKLLQNGEVYESKEVSEQTNWAYTFKDIPVTDDSLNEYDYRIEEQRVEGYQTTIDGYDLTNLRVGKISVEGNKIWLDDNSVDRPESITVKLLQNDEVIDSQEVTAENQWEYRFVELDQYDENGVAFEYTVDEEPIEGYEKTIEGYDITNLRVGTTDISGTKTWKDDQSSERPESIEVQLLQNGKKIRSQDVSAESDWNYQFTDLDQFDESGVLYNYSISEAPIHGYKTIVNGFDLTNVRTGKTDISGIKTWQDNDATDRPESITVNLLQNGVVVDEVTTTAENNWAYTFEELDQYDEDGVLYEYTIEEEHVSGYVAEVDGYDITNTRSEQRNIQVTKSWLDAESEKRPSAITVNLLRNGEIFKTVELTKDNKWTFVFESIEAFDEKGMPYSFTVEEESVEGYQTSLKGFDITNLRVGEIDISGTKTWLDDQSADRPSEIKIDLLQNGTVIDTALVTSKDNWTYSFNNLDEFDDEGVPYHYEVQEQEVAGYVSKVNGYDITNIRSELTSIEVSKVWVNDEKQDRPEFITVNLLQNGEVIKTVDISEEDQWSYVFANLDKYNENGEEYKYTINEIPVEGYDVTIEESANSFVITNTKDTSLVESEKDESILPKTGDRSNTQSIIIGLLLIILAGAIVIVSNRKKKPTE
uniref:Cna B-type domain-containing protein n=1 Tax=uncultured Allobacillus sp. TaxID=1638025 RepID=UPI002599258E|nr:Cna B-type domain-containing protein [uncultured Allobacillus sp.]